MWVWVCGISCVFRLFFCGSCLGPGTRVVYEFAFYTTHACRSGHRAWETRACGRRLPADSESSEFSRIGQPAASHLSPAQPSPKIPSPCAWEERDRDVAVTDCVVYMWRCGVLYKSVRICNVRAGVGEETGWGLFVLLPKASMPKVQAGQGSSSIPRYCLWALQLPGPPSISRPGPPAACLLVWPTPPSLRDRRGLYFGGGCLIPRADPGLCGYQWVCLGPLTGVFM